MCPHEAYFLGREGDDKQPKLKYSTVGSGKCYGEKQRDERDLVCVYLCILHTIWLTHCSNIISANIISVSSPPSQQSECKQQLWSKTEQQYFLSWSIKH